ncbi:MAG: HlyD family efflux transporter periplasmic adaptor subunit [Deltaproteobacteria bacterium]|nr:MAG: HlyD family efflux transporter periplasmic adaptor subunit [Deltaproteobacteria bacterium]
MQANEQIAGRSSGSVVDIPRKKVPKTKRNVALVAAGVLVIGGITFGLSRLKAAAPTVDRSSVWTDTVKRGSMLRQVKGPGNLVPEQIRWITADTAGRIERLPLRPGARIEAGTTLMELSNPDVMLQALDAERQLAQARADLINLRNTLKTQELAQQSTIATLHTDEADAKRKADAFKNLKGVLSDVELNQQIDKAQELQKRMQIEAQRLDVMNGSLRDQVRAQEAQIERLKAVVSFRQKQVDSMKVKSPDDGVLSELPLELGQWVTPGALLAKVVKPERLKAELRIPETQAKDVALGQKAEIDTRNGIVPGKVSRIAPSASQGSVLVEVQFGGAELPKGARPDLTVEGTVELEKLNDVLYVGRPAGAQPDSTVELFKLVKDSDIALRSKVKLGRSSVSTIEVKEGLQEGDAVVLSDMTAWDTADRVRLR